ncbi:hypothetical protein CDAR_207171 [Caerostris darwini]|uniref:Uncharacterized protein n=1 Tax=Caerostris darwini TaxID=1538125 RepID=A0AAV4SRK4_9ARAC|nr:hypothetical protein CDAR_207171 [Caerostris darwini]
MVRVRVPKARRKDWRSRDLPKGHIPGGRVPDASLYSVASVPAAFDIKSPYISFISVWNAFIRKRSCPIHSSSILFVYVHIYMDFNFHLEYFHKKAKRKLNFSSITFLLDLIVTSIVSFL